MSVPYESHGRAGQKGRTRSALISGFSAPATVIPLVAYDGTSWVSSRLSSSHFLRPPFSSFASSKPRSFTIQ